MQQIGQTNGGRLIVVSDGLENEGPNVYSNEVQSPLKAANVFVDTVAISNAASPMLSQLASDYGGQSFFLNTNDGASALNDAVSKMCQLSQAISGKSTAESVQVASQQIQINTFYAGQFLIDDSVGNETLLTFSGNLNIQVEVTRPNNGSVIGPTSPEYQTSNGNINIRIAYAEVSL